MQRASPPADTSPMDDFRTQLRDVIDAMLEGGITPAFLIIDLDGVEEIKRARDAESLQQFHQSAIDTVVSATQGADAFTYGDDRLVAILGGDFDRLKSFALIQKLRRTIPLLGQSYDCFLRPEFNIIEYDAATGVGGLIARLAARRHTGADEVA